MAVYTHIGAEQMATLLDAFDVGSLVSAKGIAEGVSNSNWLIETTGGQFILTVYEERTETADLPFFLGLLDHLAAAGCPVPRTIHDETGAGFRWTRFDDDGPEKAVALIEFLPGVSPDRPNAAQARAVGRALADVHLAARGFDGSRQNGMGPDAWRAFATSCSGRWNEIDARLSAVPEVVGDVVSHWPDDLPQSIIHADLFPDNVLLVDDRVSGMIDFYFACTGAMAYDLAVTHAAWCFSSDGTRFDEDISAALIGGYESRRKLGEKERDSLPLLAQGASLRFLLTRAYDWLNTPAGALVTRKDPMAFWHRLETYRKAGRGAFS